MDKPFKNHTWSSIHEHYTNIKTTYDLTSSDIFKQLSFDYGWVELYYISRHGITRQPSTSRGTIGRRTWDILIDNMFKIDCSPSTATYKDKLPELCIEHNYQGITAHVIDNCEPNYPELDVIINLDEMPKLNADLLQRMLTIDIIIPKINKISYIRYL